MRKTIPLFLAALCCVLLTGCTPAATPEALHESREGEPGHDEVTTVFPKGAEDDMAARYAPLPVPTAEMFGLTGLEAAIFSAVIEYERQFMADGLYLVLPRIGIFDSYETDDGAIAVICQVEARSYCKINGGLTGDGWRWSPGCVIVKKISETEYEWVEYTPAASGQSDLPGHGYAGSIHAFCGPLTELADRLIGSYAALFETEPGYFMPDSDTLKGLYRAAIGGAALSATPTEDEIRTVQGATSGPYQYTAAQGEKIEEITLRMFVAQMDTLKRTADLRTFVVVDYVLGAPEVTWDEAGQCWYAEVHAEMLYYGVVSPIGPQDAMAGQYWPVDFGRRKITRDGEMYTMELSVV